MKNLNKILFLIVLGMILTSCQGAFIALLDIIATIMIVVIVIIALILIIVHIFDK